MKTRRIFALALGALMSVSLFGACSKQPAAGGDQPSGGNEPAGKPKVGISLFYRRDAYYKDLESAFKKEAAAAGIDVIIQDADSDGAKQTQQLEDFVTQKVDAIALAACDPAGMVPAIDAAVAAGVPVVTYDGSANTDKITTFIGFDYYEDGQSVGEWAVKYINENLGGKAKIAIIDFPQSSIVCAQRADGFADTVKKLPGVEIVARQDGKASRSDSMNVMENILTANPDVNMVFGINFDTCAGAASAISAAGKNTVVCGSAYSDECFQALENNDPILKAFAVSLPQTQAKDTIAAIKKLLAGETLGKETLSHSTLYDATNIKNLDWKAFAADRG